MVRRFTPLPQLHRLLLSLSEQESRPLHLIWIEVRLLQVVHDFLVIIGINILVAVVGDVAFRRRTLHYGLLWLREHAHTWLLALFCKLFLHFLPVGCDHVLDALSGIGVQVLPRIVLGCVICRLQVWHFLLSFAIIWLILGSVGIELGIFLANATLKRSALLL